MLEYDIYLPSKTRLGTTLPQAALDRIKARVTKVFGGYTHLSHPIEGVWKMGGVTFVEAVTVLRVIAPNESAPKMAALKKFVHRILKQQETLIVERTIRLI